MKQKIFIILSVMLMIVVCVGCVQNNAFDADTIPANDTSGNGIKDTTPVDTEPEYIEDFSENLPSHLHKINGLYYLDLPEKAEADNTGNQSGQVAAPEVRFSTLEEMKQTVLSNSFSEEHKAVLAQREGNFGRKLCIPNLNMLDKIKSLSMIEQQWCLFGEQISVRGKPKDNLYGDLRVNVHYYNSEEACDAYANRFIYQRVEKDGEGDVDFKGVNAKKIASNGFSLGYLYETQNDDVQITLLIIYAVDENNISVGFPAYINLLVKNKNDGMYFRCYFGDFEKDPPLDWIMQFAEISE